MVPERKFGVLFGVICLVSAFFYRDGTGGHTCFNFVFVRLLVGYIQSD